MPEKKRGEIIIRGKKVTLRDLNERDIASLWYWHYECSNPEWVRWYTPYKPIEKSTRDEFYTEQKWEIEEALKKQVPTKLAIEVDGKFIGFVRRYWIDKNTNWLNIGICIYDPDYWSGGYGTEAFRLWMRFLFDHMDIVRLGIATWSGNERMINLAKKLGMKHEGTIRKARLVDGQYYDSINMGILREEWEQVERGQYKESMGS